MLATFGVATVAARSTSGVADPETDGYVRQGRMWMKEGAPTRRAVTAAPDRSGFTREGRVWVRRGDGATGGGGGAELDLVKTVGTDLSVCAATGTIEVPAFTQVAYCFFMTNTGSVTLSLHDVFDDQLGQVLGPDFPATVGPGGSAFFTVSTTIGTADVTNTATWTGSVLKGPSASDTDSATVTVLQPEISLDKTVGTDVNACAATDEISVVDGTLVVYCFFMTNTGSVTLSLHDVFDDQLGQVLGPDFPATVGPGVSAFFTVSTTIGPTSVTNTATWTASIPVPPLGGSSATSTDTAIVNVVPVPVELQSFDVE
jgi:hypothetical protein